MPAEESRLTKFPALDGEIRTVIVESHTVYAFGLEHLLRQIPGVILSGIFHDHAAALAALDQLAPSLLIFDCVLPEQEGLLTLERMMQMGPGLRVVVITMHSMIPFALRALRLGARGFLQKDQTVSQITAAIQQVIAGAIYLDPALQSGPTYEALFKQKSSLRDRLDSLTLRERDVFRAMGHQRSTAEIAQALSLSVKTIETHRAHICKKLGLSSSATLARFAVDWLVVQEKSRNWVKATNA